MVVVHTPSFRFLKYVLWVVHGHHTRMRDKVWKSPVIMAVLFCNKIQLENSIKDVKGKRGDEIQPFELKGARNSVILYAKCCADMHTWDNVPMRRRVDKHTAG